jgi:hypothetical protein
MKTRPRFARDVLGQEGFLFSPLSPCSEARIPKKWILGSLTNDSRLAKQFQFIKGKFGQILKL